MVKKYIDLHSHTFYSDGCDDPKSLIRAAKLKGTDIFAITDHDTLDGYFRGIEEAKKWNICLIPGVEVTTKHYHILGLNIDPYNRDFANFLAHIRGLQEKVCQQRIEMAHAAGLPITLEKVIRAFPHSRIGKYNLLMTIIQDPECIAYTEQHHPGASPDDLFTSYFKKGGIAGSVEQRHYVRAKEAIDAIHAADGVAIVAHPFKQIKADIPRHLDSLVAKGIDGLEIQPNYGSANNPFRAYALENSLLMSYGSDYHGPTVARPLLGRGQENGIDEEDFEKLLIRGRENSYA